MNRILSFRVHQVGLPNLHMNPDLNSTAGSTSEGKPSGRWNPYLVGTDIGVLSWIVFAVVNMPLGASTPMSSAASLCAVPILGSEAVAQNAYWTKFPFKWDYHMLFIVGVFFGSLRSVLVGRSFKFEAVPAT